jgi:hypothetical protein
MSLYPNGIQIHQPKGFRLRICYGVTSAFPPSLRYGATSRAGQAIRAG